MRLAKYLAHCGVASRRGAETLISHGVVTVGGERVIDPARDVDASSGVAVNGTPVLPEPHEVWAVNKPLDVTSTAREPGRRRPVTALVDSERRLYPVGRLDADSTGLILLTNDGELANRLTHPRYGIPKTYLARLRRPPSPRDLRRLAEGVKLDDGQTAPAEVALRGRADIEITIREGRNRQIRRMVKKIGNEVVSLRRVRFASLELGDLPLGGSRRLSRSEVKRLWKDAGSMDERGKGTR
ncbi:MAG: rRNA pseudouridine synthase [Solirubrobacterales bacterium]|nr:rRNA pseudouridine synthase [Solirubrobacterales bacterium]MCB8970438.1 rRNA pseudouridine synthase [Thermoleophilales bacterium]MCO5325599.1 rRNA pseudouridine synthase [Solirubrobacterales bacterium]